MDTTVWMSVLNVRRSSNDSGIFQILYFIVKFFVKVIPRHKRLFENVYGKHKLEKICVEN